MLGLGETDGLPGLLHPLPSLVAVHGEEPAADRSDGRRPVQILDEGAQLVGGTLRRAVAAVGEDMDHDFRPAGGQDFGQGRHMALVAMHAAG